MRVLSRLPLHPLLLAAYAVVGVYAANIREVLPRDLAWPVAVALFGSAVALLVCTVLYRDLRRGAILATALVAAAAYFGHVASLLDSGIDERVQLGLWLVFVVGAALYAWRGGGSIATATAALNAFGIVLMALALTTILPFELGREAQAAEPLDPAVDPPIATTSHPGRDIYFLVFDRYGSDWSLRESFGIENDLVADLEAAGFQVVPGARANYHASDFSLAATLNLRLHDDLAASIGGPSTDRTPVRQRLQDHEVGRILQANGYRYYHLGAWWDPTRSSPIADEVLAWGSTTEFESVLREATIVPALERLSGIDRSDTASRDQHREQALFAFRQLRRLARSPERTFVFAHILMPHPPYVLAEGGRVVYKEEAESKSEAELMEQQLRFTNEKIRETVTTLLAGPDEEDPIIVITGDEGPYLCYEVDCVDGSPRVYGIRLGVLRAYYLPELEVQVPPDDSGVNIFRMLLREYFGADLPDLPNRSFGWVDKERDLYTFRDVTDVLPLPGS